LKTTIISCTCPSRDELTSVIKIKTSYKPMASMG
jgi:hypothetical protein